MHKLFLIAGSLFAGLGVIIGAFGAHALKPTLEANGRLETFETAVRYQFYHALALLFLGLLMTQLQHKLFALSGYGFIMGIVFFSGSLYVLSLTDVSKLGMIAPIGGLSFVLGWMALCWGLIQTLK